MSRSSGKCWNLLGILVPWAVENYVEVCIASTVESGTDRLVGTKESRPTVVSHTIK